MTLLHQATQVHKALAHPARLRILAMLRSGELCACQVTAVLELAPSTVSAHLAELRRAGLVSERKDGRWVHLRLSRAAGIRQILKSVWRQLQGDRQVDSDAAVLQELRAIPVEDLCRVDLNLERLHIARTRVAHAGG